MNLLYSTTTNLSNDLCLDYVYGIQFSSFNSKLFCLIFRNYDNNLFISKSSTIQFFFFRMHSLQIIMKLFVQVTEKSWKIILNVDNELGHL